MFAAVAVAQAHEEAALATTTAASAAVPTTAAFRAATGWFNRATGVGALHALHDHGDAHWACVYFAAAEGVSSADPEAADPAAVAPAVVALDDGSSSGSSDVGGSNKGDGGAGNVAKMAGGAAGRGAGFRPLAPRHLGHLLLRFQLQAFTQRFGFVAAPPIPGDLWVFPGHVAHAVAPTGASAVAPAAGAVAVPLLDGGLPTCLLEGSAGVAALVLSAPLLRLSFAFNVFL
jgi:hypothetical protein